MKQIFENNNYEVVSFEEKSDVYIINTCTVTSMSDKKSRQMIRRAKQLNPEAMVIAIGCYAQVGKEELSKIDEIDLILGNNEKNDILKFVEDAYNKKIKIELLDDVFKTEEFLDFGTTIKIEKTRAIVKIQDGCDRFCSYCIIPYARGKVRSRKIESTVKEIKELVKKGIKEIVLTGIHIASYGKEFKNNISLIDLLEEINKIEGLERIRLGSLEPTLITEEFTERLSKLSKICHHFHLSLQSACNTVLERMNRKYSIEEFKNGVFILRKYFNDVILTTDIIVGFPGETEEEFDKTFKELNEIKFYKMHIFKYSRRKGTKAYMMENQINDNIKDVRSKILLKLSNKNQYEYNKNYIGKEVKVLFEEKENNYIKGHTPNYLIVKVGYNEMIDFHNKILNVKIIGFNKENLIGEIIL